MVNKSQHTPTPEMELRLETRIKNFSSGAGSCNLYFLVDLISGFELGPMADKSDAAFIERAVNYHQELIEALKHDHALVDPDCEGHCPTAKVIAKAEGQ